MLKIKEDTIINILIILSIIIVLGILCYIGYLYPIIWVLYLLILGELTIVYG